MAILWFENDLKCKLIVFMLLILVTETEFYSTLLNVSTVGLLIISVFQIKHKKSLI